MSKEKDEETALWDGEGNKEGVKYTTSGQEDPDVKKDGGDDTIHWHEDGNSIRLKYTLSGRQLSRSEIQPPNGLKIDNKAKKSGGTWVNFYIYFSHFLTSWAERMWTFAVGLYMIELTPNNLQLTAIYGLTMAAVVLLFAPIVGDWVDSVQRLRAARVTLILQTLFVILNSAVIYCFLMFKNDILSWGDYAKYIAYGLIILLAALSLLSNTANTITVEKDWIVQICDGDNENLTVMTARMRVIDLTTQLVAPVATGQVMTFVGLEAGAIFIAGWNLVTVVIEYYLIWKVYTVIPALRTYKDVSKSVGARNKAKNSGCLAKFRIFSSFVTMIQGWKTYASYKVFLSGISLGFLFLTVLGFDSITVGYSKIQGLSESLIGILTGAAGIVGIIGSLCYPTIARCLGLPRGGMLALILLLACLSMCVISLWLPGSPFELYDDKWITTNQTDSDTHNRFVYAPDHSLISVFVLLVGIITARFGLWVADLSITQMFMLTVKEEERGVVFGVQNAINQLMGMIKFILVTVLPLAPQFGYLTLASFASISTAAFLYLIYLCRLPQDLFTKPGYKQIK